jgi:hypothetical protein
LSAIARDVPAGEETRLFLVATQTNKFDDLSYKKVLSYEYVPNLVWIPQPKINTARRRTGIGTKAFFGAKLGTHSYCEIHEYERLSYFLQLYLTLSYLISCNFRKH